MKKNKESNIETSDTAISNSDVGYSDLETDTSTATIPIAAYNFSDELVYDINTKIVYIRSMVEAYAFSEGFYHYTPYLSENGKYCRYINGEIQELECE